MNKLARSVLALYPFDENPEDNSLENMLRQSVELIARIPIIAAQAYQVSRHYYAHDSMYLHIPPRELSTAECLLYCIRPNKKYTDEEAKLLDLCLMLHAEHGGGNNSAFVGRVMSSSGTDTYSAISAAIGSLKGPARRREQAGCVLSDIERACPTGRTTRRSRHTSRRLYARRPATEAARFTVWVTRYTRCPTRAR